MSWGSSALEHQLTAPDFSEIKENIYTFMAKGELTPNSQANYYLPSHSLGCFPVTSGFHSVFL